MQGITPSSILFLWIHMLTSVKGQVKECTLEAFLNDSRLYDSNFDTTRLVATYADTKQVRVGCNVGFTGFFKLICDDGKWKSRGSKCQPKSCGHPGDAQFAEFHLERGDDFVFGSEVVYTCQTGYQMASRTNSRRCMAEGWDGVIPVCEAQQCPVIHVDDNVQVIGDAEEATFGNVIRFGCRSTSLILDPPGLTEIHCEETGQWSGDIPKCIPPVCPAPVIENGQVPDNISEYKEGETLHFQCKAKYKPTGNTPPKCTKINLQPRSEWSPTPLCEPITCRLTLPPIGGTSYEPEFRSVFSPGDTVTVICGPTYWFSLTRETRKQVTCRDDGTWDVSPVCQEVTCANPHDDLVSEWRQYYYQKKRLDDTVRYWCKAGYKTTDGRNLATCTRDGWTPNPLCREITCNKKQDIPSHAVIDGDEKSQYKYHERVEYVCKGDYTGSFTLTCGTNGWSGTPNCREIICNIEDVRHATVRNNNKRQYKNNEAAQYDCVGEYTGNFTRTCGVHGWTGAANCKERTCTLPLDYDLLITPRESDWRRRLRTRQRYSCKTGYKHKDGEDHATCTTDGWTPNPLCEEIICNREDISHAKIVGNSKMQYKNSEAVQYDCVGYYTGSFTLTCGADGWTGDRTCTDKCPKPRVENGFAVEHNGSFFYSCNENYKPLTKGWWSEIKCNHGASPGPLRCIEKRKCVGVPEIPHAAIPNIAVEYEEGHIPIVCDEGYAPSIDQITCLKGKWGLNGIPLTEICKPLAKPCNPPPRVENAVVMGAFQKKYLSETEVSYQCRDKYAMEGGNVPTIRCTDGTWERRNIRCVGV